MDLLNLLSNTYVFRDVPGDVLIRLVDQATVKDVVGGDPIIRQFERGNDVFIILEGEALSRTLNGEVVARFGPGSLIGEVALLDGEPRSTNVVAVKGAKIATIPGSAIKGAMESDPRVGYTIATNIAKVLCMRLRAMNEQMDGLNTPRR